MTDEMTQQTTDTLPRRALPPEKRNPGRIIALVVGVAMIVSGLALGGWVWKYGGIFGSGAAGATSPEAAVQGFLEALAKSDANEALSYAAADPQNKAYLTGETMAGSRANHPLTNIMVGPAASGVVPVSFTLGQEKIEASFATVNVGFIYRVVNVATQVKISGQSAAIPLLVQNQPVKEPSIWLFPGIYDLSTSAKHLGYDVQTLKVLPSEPIDLALKPLITESGKKAVVASAKAQLQKCINSTTPVPEGCIVQFDPPAGIKLKQNGVKYTLLGDDPTDSLKVELNPASPGILKLPISMDLRVLATSEDNKSYTGTEHFNFLNVDLVKDPIEVSFTR